MGIDWFDSTNSEELMTKSEVFVTNILEELSTKGLQVILQAFYLH